MLGHSAISETPLSALPQVDVDEGPANLKTADGLAKASVKTFSGLAIASVKTVNGLD